MNIAGGALLLWTRVFSSANRRRSKSKLPTYVLGLRASLTHAVSFESEYITIVSDLNRAPGKQHDPFGNTVIL